MSKKTSARLFGAAEMVWPACWTRLANAAPKVASVAGFVWLLAATYAFHHSLWHGLIPWHGWADQDRYLASAVAWWHGNLDPQQHNYPPGYALLAAPFTWLTPWSPFELPDLACLLAAFWLFRRVCARLVPETPLWTASVILAFCVATVGLHVLRWLWFVPWTTTAATPLQYGALLAAMRLGEATGTRRAFLMGCVLGVLAGFRPADSAVLIGVCFSFAAMLPAGGIGARTRIVGFAVAGLLAGALPFVILHAAAHQGAAGQYLAGSARIGFEWRLLPLRWVLIVLDSRPLTAEGPGTRGGHSLDSAGDRGADSGLFLPTGADAKLAIVRGRDRAALGSVSLLSRSRARRVVAVLQCPLLQMEFSAVAGGGAEVGDRGAPGAGTARGIFRDHGGSTVVFLAGTFCGGARMAAARRRRRKFPDGGRSLVGEARCAAASRRRTRRDLQRRGTAVGSRCELRQCFGV